ncbi:hypothetical protein [uncultured Alistipes sp.]
MCDLADRIRRVADSL